MSKASVNFGFLATHSAVLVEDAARAERHARQDPRSCVACLRVFAEGLAKHAAAYAGVYVSDRDELSLVLGRLRDQGVMDGAVAQLFRTLRENGNDAVHAGAPGRPRRAFTHHDALQGLKIARNPRRHRPREHEGDVVLRPAHEHAVVRQAHAAHRGPLRPVRAGVRR